MVSEPTIAEERARELLEYSSTGVRSELEQAQGWLRAGQVPGEPQFWRIDAVAGAIGDLANAYGRMVLWSRVAGVTDVEGALTNAIDTLVRLRQDIETSATSAEEITELRRVAEEMESIHSRLVEASGVSDD